VPSLYPATSVAFGCLHRASAALRAMPANRARQGDKPLLARVFKPRGDEPFPALVECHGGGSSDRRARHFMFIYAPSVQLSISRCIGREYRKQKRPRVRHAGAPPKTPYWTRPSGRTRYWRGSSLLSARSSTLEPCEYEAAAIERPHPVDTLLLSLIGRLPKLQAPPTMRGFFFAGRSARHRAALFCVSKKR
jgi:hypothetical protein